jgi:hypothetical protein
MTLKAWRHLGMSGPSRNAVPDLFTDADGADDA